MNPVRIPLGNPFKLGEKVYDHIRVRAPTYGDYMDIGEALESQTIDGVKMTVEHLDRLREYAARCVSTGDDAIAEPAVLAAGGFPLARKVREAVLGFLYPPVVAPGTTSPTT